MEGSDGHVPSTIAESYQEHVLGLASQLEAAAELDPLRPGTVNTLRGVGAAVVKLVRAIGDIQGALAYLEGSEPTLGEEALAASPVGTSTLRRSQPSGVDVRREGSIDFYEGIVDLSLVARVESQGVKVLIEVIGPRTVKAVNGSVGLNHDEAACLGILLVARDKWKSSTALVEMGFKARQTHQGTLVAFGASIKELNHKLGAITGEDIVLQTGGGRWTTYLLNPRLVFYRADDGDGAEEIVDSAGVDDIDESPVVEATEPLPTLTIPRSLVEFKASGNTFDDVLRALGEKYPGHEFTKDLLVDVLAEDRVITPIPKGRGEDVFSEYGAKRLVQGAIREARRRSKLPKKT